MKVAIALSSLVAGLASGCTSVIQAVTTRPMSYEQLAPIIPGPTTIRDGEVHIPLRFDSEWLQQNSAVTICRIDAMQRGDQIEFTAYRAVASGGSAVESAISVLVQEQYHELHLVYVGPDDSRTEVGVVQSREPAATP